MSLQLQVNDPVKPALSLFTLLFTLTWDRLKTLQASTAYKKGDLVYVIKRHTYFIPMAHFSERSSGDKTEGIPFSTTILAGRENADLESAEVKREGSRQRTSVFV